MQQGPAIVRSFTVEDLVEGYIYYEQSDHRNKEPVADALLFTVTDGNNTTPYNRLNITITVRHQINGMKSLVKNGIIIVHRESNFMDFISPPYP